VERKGWLLYSTPALDARLLAEKNGDELGIKGGSSMEIYQYC